jgi:hypothetical protein
LINKKNNNDMTVWIGRDLLATPTILFNIYYVI